MKTLIIIPTYNEKDNIAAIIPEIFKQGLMFDNVSVNVLVVDDNSPDGTADVVRGLQKTNPSVHLLVREKKNGLGRAYISGFEWGLKAGYDILVEMDADFSHRPKDLKALIEGCIKNDFAVGSRYIKGGSVVNWGLSRRLISRGGGIYSRIILGHPLNDWTGGFNAWKKKTLEGIDLSTVESNGYSFQIELKYRALSRKFKGVEVPIVFEERREGQSKMSGSIVWEALFRVWKMRFS